MMLSTHRSLGAAGPYGPTHWLAIHARHRPNEVWLDDRGRDRELTFGDVDRFVRSVTRSFVDRGLENGDRVAAIAGDSHEYVEAVLACINAGLTIVPLNIRLTQAELGRVFKTVDPRLVLVDDRNHPKAAAALRESGSNSQLILMDSIADGGQNAGSTAEAEPVHDRVSQAHPTNVFALSPTSGTTGEPKLVVQSLEMVTNLAVTKVIDHRLNAEDVFYSGSPLFHVSGVASMLASLAVGHRLVLLERFDTQQLLAMLRSGELTVCFLVPTMISSLLEAIRDRESFEGLHTLIYGGAPVTAPLLKRARATFSCDFIQLFGSGTEVGLQCSLGRADHQRAFEDAPHLLRSVGKPSFGVELRITDPQGRDVEVGEVGEIRTRSHTQMDGYLDESVPMGVLEDGWFSGRDLGYRDEDGYVYVVGRTGDVIIRGGENIYPLEVEEVLRAHVKVSDAAVVGVLDDHWGEVVHAFVVPSGHGLDLEELGLFCRSRLAAHKVPATIHPIDELPRSTVGKVLKRELRAAAARQPDSRKV